MNCISLSHVCRQLVRHKIGASDALPMASRQVWVAGAAGGSHNSCCCCCCWEVSDAAEIWKAKSTGRNESTARVGKRCSGQVKASCNRMRVTVSFNCLCMASAGCWAGVKRSQWWGVEPQHPWATRQQGTTNWGHESLVWFQVTFSHIKLNPSYLPRWRKFVSAMPVASLGSKVSGDVQAPWGCFTQDPLLMWAQTQPRLGVPLTCLGSWGFLRPPPNRRQNWAGELFPCMSFF